MKTSVIEVHDMLSVLSVDGVEERIGKVPGVESVTVNYAVGSATVRYDETRLEIADIKSAVHQSGHQSAGEFLLKPVSEAKPARKRAVVLWGAAFGLYAVRYWPVLTRLRLGRTPG